MFAERNQDPNYSPDGANFGGQSSEFALHYNPLNRQIKDTISFREGDLAGLTATVNQISATRVVIGTDSYTFADYDLSAPQTEDTRYLADEDGVVRIRLRCLPGDQGQFETIAFQAQRLEQGAGWIFDNHKAQIGTVSLRDHAGNFQHGFSRIDEVSVPYSGARTVLGDPRAPDAGVSELSHYKIEYLDYVRTTQDSSGAEYNQWALIEFNRSTEALVTLFGWDIDPGSFR